MLRAVNLRIPLISLHLFPFSLFYCSLFHSFPTSFLLPNSFSVNVTFYILFFLPFFFSAIIPSFFVYFFLPSFLLCLLPFFFLPFFISCLLPSCFPSCFLFPCLLFYLCMEVTLASGLCDQFEDA